MIGFYGGDQIIEDPIVRSTKICNIFLRKVDRTHKIKYSKSSKNTTWKYAITKFNKRIK